MPQYGPPQLCLPLADITAAAERTDACADCNAGLYLVTIEAKPRPEWLVLPAHERDCPNAWTGFQETQTQYRVLLTAESPGVSDDQPSPP